MLSNKLFSSTIKNLNLVTSEGTLVEGFEIIGDWTAHGTGCTIEATSNCKSGSSALKVNFVSTAFSYITKVISQTFSTEKNFIFWVYVDDSTKLAYIQINFSSDGYSAKSMKIQLNVSEGTLVNGWNRIVVDKTKFIVTGSESWSNTMNRLIVVAVGISGQSSYVIFDDLRSNYTSKAKIVITFDDGYQNVYDNAIPILEENNQKAVFFVPHCNVGYSFSWALSLAEMTELYNKGNDICNHTWNHLPDLTALTDASLNYEIATMDDYLATNGFSSRIFFAYPYYIYNDTVINYLRTKGLKMARANGRGIYQPHLKIDGNNYQYIIKSVEVNSAVSTATVQGYIDQVINQNGFLVLSFHQIVDSSATGTSVLTSDFEIISDYLKAKENDASLNVITFSNYYKLLI
ncbi:MAG: polysaccharide deacetylase family protein [Candidatus Nanoarchaeia archaeon]|nr:polysaccharide deacetylase family protein [Candidatus Nanoarchaeia archaeon]